MRLCRLDIGAIGEAEVFKRKLSCDIGIDRVPSFDCSKRFLASSASSVSVVAANVEYMMAGALGSGHGLGHLTQAQRTLNGTENDLDKQEII